MDGKTRWVDVVLIWRVSTISSRSNGIKLLKSTLRSNSMSGGDETVCTLSQLAGIFSARKCPLGDM